MGRKVHPYGFRVGVYKDWQSKWFSERDYAQLVQEDMRLRIRDLLARVLSERPEAFDMIRDRAFARMFH